MLLLLILPAPPFCTALCFRCGARLLVGCKRLCLLVVIAPCCCRGTARLRLLLLLGCPWDDDAAHWQPLANDRGR